MAPTPATDERVPSPLRWAGGKRWLLPTINDLIGDTDIAAYHEPFLGGASVFLGLPQFSKAHVGDMNAALIATYRAIRDHPEELAEAICRPANDSESYYEMRESSPDGAVQRAARFIYLNHTSFNGIYRVNLAGKYNVPFGDRSSRKIPTAEHLLKISERLQGATLHHRDFAKCISNVERGDLVFLDPPYTVAHNFNGFVKYNQRLFSFDDQRRLSGLVDAVKEKGGYYVLTNARHESIAKLFDKGDTVIETSRKNVIGGVGAERGSATEYLFTNLGAPKP